MSLQILYQEEKKEQKIRENTEKMENEIRKLQNDSLESVFIIEEQGAEIRYFICLTFSQVTILFLFFYSSTSLQSWALYNYRFVLNLIKFHCKLIKNSLSDHYKDSWDLFTLNLSL